MFLFFLNIFVVRNSGPVCHQNLAFVNGMSIIGLKEVCAASNLDEAWPRNWLFRKEGRLKKERNKQTNK